MVLTKTSMGHAAAGDERTAAFRVGRDRNEVTDNVA